MPQCNSTSNIRIMTTLYLIRGVPGSGKSTLAQQLVTTGLVTSAYEADQFFVNNGIYQFRSELLPAAHSWCQEQVESCLVNGQSVAVANTSTTEKEVLTYQRLAEKYSATFVSLVVENRHGGKNLHSVPDDKIQQMINRFSVKL